MKHPEFPIVFPSVFLHRHWPPIFSFACLSLYVIWKIINVFLWHCEYSFIKFEHIRSSFLFFFPRVFLYYSGDNENDQLSGLIELIDLDLTQISIEPEKIVRVEKLKQVKTSCTWYIKKTLFRHFPLSACLKINCGG